MKCPICNNECDFDEIDIGIGTQKGNYHCDHCGWVEKETLDKLFGEEDL